MGLDTRFVTTSDIDTYYVDKDSGAPLAGGIVEFFSDTNHSIQKPVYQISVVSPGVYSYSALPNPCILSSVGTFQDALGNNIVPYYFPFQGTYPAGNGTQELYYITVKSSGNVPQLTRNGWPNSAAGSTSIRADVTNFIPSGQFLAHNQIISSTEPPTVTVAYGSINLNSQIIAPGGWSFRVNVGSTSVFTNSFIPLPGPISGLFDTPQYAFNFQCTVFVGGDTSVADLTITWPDVNTFSSPAASPSNDPQEYTFTFAADSNDGNSYIFNIYSIYNFGTGGSPTSPIETLLDTITVQPTWEYHSVTIDRFIPNNGTIGTDNNSSISLAIRCTTACNALFTDFSLVIGSVSPTAFPIATSFETLAGSVFGSMPVPAYDGSDIYLPLLLGPAGVIFDDSSIGSIEAHTSSAPGGNLLACDGTNYLSSAYSALGIPYSRLRDKLFNSTANANIFGTGADFFNVVINNGALATMIISTNQFGLQTNPAQGATSTTFTLSGTGYINPGSAVSNFPYLYRWYTNSTGIVTAISTFFAATSGGNIFADSGGPTTTGISFTPLSSPVLGNQRFATKFQCTSAATLTKGAGVAAAYFTFYNTSATICKVWFNVAGETAPVGGTLIEVKLLASATAVDVANVLSAVLNGYQTNAVLAVAGAAVPLGSWFTINANSKKYVVWYKVSGSGTQPVVASTEGYIEVDVTTADSNATVAQKTIAAINKFKVATPDLRGLFLRGNDPTGIYDLYNAARWSVINDLAYTNAGTFEFHQFAAHTHNIFLDSGGAGASTTVINAPQGAARNTHVTGQLAASGPTTDATATINPGSETAPVNMSVNYFIKY